MILCLTEDVAAFSAQLLKSEEQYSLIKTLSSCWIYLL